MVLVTKLSRLVSLYETLKEVKIHHVTNEVLGYDNSQYLNIPSKKQNLPTPPGLMSRFSLSHKLLLILSLSSALEKKLIVNSILSEILLTDSRNDCPEK